MRSSSRKVLCLDILDAPKFFMNLARLADQDSKTIVIECDGVKLERGKLGEMLAADRLEDAIDFKVILDGSVVVSFHDSIDNAFAETSVSKYIQALSSLSLVRYTECMLELGMTERILSWLAAYWKKH